MRIDRTSADIHGHAAAGDRTSPRAASSPAFLPPALCYEYSHCPMTSYAYNAAPPGRIRQSQADMTSDTYGNAAVWRILRATAAEQVEHKAPDPAAHDRDRHTTLTD